MKRYKSCLIGIVCGGLIGLIFYRHFLLMILFSGIGLSVSFCYKPNQRSVLLLEFKEFLNGIHSELLVGQSFRHAIQLTLEVQIISNVSLGDALDHLHKSISLGVDEVKAWQELSDKLHEEYIKEFAVTLKATYYYSGDVVTVIKNTIDSISDAIDLTLEINVILISKRIEFLTMIMLPIGLLGLLSVTQYDYMSVLYESMLGRVIMTGVMLVMSVAYLIGHYIARIDI
jgi:tight adherence protein B